MTSEPAGQGAPRTLGLDLVRASAIMLVLISHWSNNIAYWFGVKHDGRIHFTGELGVSLFFGLSGFLIGRILLETASASPTGRNLAAFLVRRWMRTLPLYWVWLVVLMLFVPPAQDVLLHAVRFATMTQNLATPMPPGWWYAVSWSLVVEEWFYILFGSATFLAFRMVRRDWAIWIPIAVFLIVPTLIRLALPGYTANAQSMNQIALLRIDQITYGVVVAVLHRQRSKLFDRPRLLAFGALLLIGSQWDARVWWRLLSVGEPIVHYNLLMTACVSLLPLALKLKTAPAWLSAPTRAVSAWSYGIYIVHLTILEHVAQGLWTARPDLIWVAVAIAVVAPFLLAWLSFRFFEAPILKLRPHQKPSALSGPHLMAAPTATAAPGEQLLGRI